MFCLYNIVYWTSCRSVVFVVDDKVGNNEVGIHHLHGIVKSIREASGEASEHAETVGSVKETLRRALELSDKLADNVDKI